MPPIPSLRRRALRGVALAVLALALALPTLPSAAQDDPVSVLVWTGTYGFRHPSITQAQRAFLELDQANDDVTVRITENPAELNATVLSTVDVLVWVSTTGKPPMTEEQRADIIRFAACGGGNMAFHAAADSNYGWAEYAELLGAQFDSHPYTGVGTMLVEDDAHPITAGWAGLDSFQINDEWYRWRTAKRLPGISLPRQLPDVRVLLSLDEASVDPEIQAGPLAYEDDQPIAWTKTFRGGGRVYYNNMGHNEATWDVPEFRTSLANGIGWTSEVALDAECFASDDPLPPPPAPPAADPALVGEACTIPEVPERSGFTWEQSGPIRALTPAGDELELPSAGVPGNLQWGAQGYVLDLSEARAATADLTVELDIPVPSDDYDLSVTAPWGWYGSDQNAGATTETLTIEDAPHCSILWMYGDNLLAAGSLFSGQAPTLRVAVEPGPPVPVEPPVEQPPTTDVVRIAADSDAPVDLAVAWSQARPGRDDADGCGCALLARDDDFADALASGGAQAAIGAPLLLTPSGSLAPATRAELERLGVARVVILGGTAAVSEDVADELRARDIEVERIGGATRIETAVEIAEAYAGELTGDPLVVRAYGTPGDETAAFADSLTAGREAARSRRPVLLTEAASLTSAVADHLQGRAEDAVVVVGGSAAVGDDVLEDLRQLGLAAPRVAGDDRAGTAVAVARALAGAASAADADGVVLLDGWAPSAWAEGFAAAGYDGVAGPLVLANGEALPPATAAWLGGAADGDGAGEGSAAVPLVCGALVSDAACAAAAEALRIDAAPGAA